MRLWRTTRHLCFEDRYAEVRIRTSTVFDYFWLKRGGVLSAPTRSWSTRNSSSWSSKWQWFFHGTVEPHTRWSWPCRTIHNIPWIIFYNLIFHLSTPDWSPNWACLSIFGIQAISRCYMPWSHLRGVSQASIFRDIGECLKSSVSTGDLDHVRAPVAVPWRVGIFRSASHG
jgi:hypothetical protein